MFYVTVPLSYLLLFIMLILGLTAENMVMGIRFMLTPDLSRILDLSVSSVFAEHTAYFYNHWGGKYAGETMTRHSQHPVTLEVEDSSACG